MKRIIYFAVASALMFTSCGALINSGMENSNGNHSDSGNGSISKDYWGKWQRMDTGKFYYIDSDYVYEGEEPYSDWWGGTTNIYHNGEFGMGAYVFDGDNIINKKKSDGSTDFLLFRVGGSSKNFSVNVSGFTTGPAGNIRAATNLSGVKGKRENSNNASDTQTVSISSESTLDFTGAVAGDTQTITLSGSGNSYVGAIEVCPEYSGQNVGTIPLIGQGEYGFSITADKTTMYAGKSETIRITMKNIGDRDCPSGSYSVSTSDNNATLVGTDGKTSATFGTKEMGSSITIDVELSYGKITRAYVDVPIDVVIMDYKNAIWRDKVIVRVFRGDVTLTARLASLVDASKRLSGFIIYPDGNSKHFELTPNENTVSFPWSTEDYYIVFSGASAQSELYYSFSFDGNPESLAGADSPSTDEEVDRWFKVMSAYESNDSISIAPLVNISRPVTAYLSKGDVDFYRVNVSSLECD